MLEGSKNVVARRVLVVDDELANPTTAGGHAVRALVSELQSRAMEVVESYSCEDGTAVVQSDASLVSVFVNWTLGRNDRRSHAEATELLRAIRARNATIPIFLMADRKVAGRSGQSH
jgi:arginine decarboxylase